MANPYSLLDALPKTLSHDMLVPNLCIRFSIIEEIKSATALFSYVQIKDFQKPEDVAWEQYGSQDLYWIIMLMNDMVDPFYDWVLSEEDLLKSVQRKYGVDSVYAVHHYRTTSQSDLGEGEWVSAGEPFFVPITNWDYEYELNESKRKIKILDPSFIPQVLAELKKEITILINNT